jgi:hypothetical protein
MVFKRENFSRLNKSTLLLVSLTIQGWLKVNISDNNINSTSHFTSQSGVEPRKKSTQQDAKCLIFLMELKGIEPSAS